MSGIIVTSVNFTVAHETKTNAKSSEFRRQISLTLGLQLDPVIHTLTPTHTLTHSVVVAFGGRETGSGSASSLLWVCEQASSAVSVSIVRRHANFSPNKVLCDSSEDV